MPRAPTKDGVQTRNDKSSTLTGLLAALTPPTVTADTKVQHAFALGWHTTELWLVEPAKAGPASKPAASSGAPAWPPQELKAIHLLGGDKITDILVRQIGADIDHLPERSVPDPAPLAGHSHMSGVSRPDKSMTIEDFHAECIAGLMAESPDLASAYLLGVDLGDCVLRAYKRAVVKQEDSRVVLQELLGERSIRIARSARELKQGLGEYVADSVAASLEDWAAWARNNCQPSVGKKELSSEELADLFYQQGSVWRTLLTGQRKSADYLSIRDYLRAALSIVDDYGRLAWRLMTKPAFVVLVIFFLVLVVVVVVSSSGAPTGPLASAVTALSALGVTGTSLLAGLRRLLNEADGVLWHAEVGAAVAQAVNKLPDGVARDATAHIGSKVS